MNEKKHLIIPVFLCFFTLIFLASCGSPEQDNSDKTTFKYITKYINKSDQPWLPWVEPEGIANWGASCYFNGMMQMLMASKVFVSGILSQSKEQVQKLLPDERTQINAIKNFFAARVRSDSSAEKLKAAAGPIIDSFPDFRCNIQSDAEELGRQIMAAAQVPSLEIKIITHIFKDNLKVKELTHVDKEFLPQLDLPNKDSDLQTIFNNFGKVEEIRGDNQIDITVEGKKTKSDYLQRQFFISKLPKEIFFHLKRFINISYTKREKNSTSVLLPDDENIDLKNIVTPEIMAADESVLYKLKAITVHSGSLDGGHYVAYVRYDSQWYYCNDSSCTKITYDIIKNDDNLRKGSYIISLERVVK